MKILVASDGSSHSSEAIDLLGRIRLPEGSEIEIVTVVEHPVVYAGSHGLRDQVSALTEARQLATAEQLVSDTSERLAQDHVSVRSVIREGEPAEVILNRARSRSVDLIVAGSRGLTALDRFLLGSTTERLLEHAPCDVLVSRPVNVDMPARTTDRLHIQIAYDGSPAAEGAVDDLLRLPMGTNCEVRLVTVLALQKSFRMDILQHLSEGWSREKQAAETGALAAAGRLEAAGFDRVQVRIEESEDIAQHLVNLAQQWPADLLMTGANGHSQIEEFLLGRISKRLTRHAPCAVWLTRPTSATQ